MFSTVALLTILLHASETSTRAFLRALLMHSVRQATRAVSGKLCPCRRGACPRGACRMPQLKALLLDLVVYCAPKRTAHSFENELALIPTGHLREHTYVHAARQCNIIKYQEEFCVGESRVDHTYSLENPIVNYKKQAGSFQFAFSARSKYSDV